MIRGTGTPPAVGSDKEPRGVGPPDLLLVSELKQALRQRGCPLCRLIRDADRHYLSVFLREGKDDGRMLLRLLASWGLCARHANLLRKHDYRFSHEPKTPEEERSWVEAVAVIGGTPTE